jgi:hypothetical protein
LGGSSSEDPDQEALEAFKYHLLAIKYLRNLNRLAVESDHDYSDDENDEDDGDKRLVGAGKRAIIKPRIGRNFELFSGASDSWPKRAVFKPRIGRSFDQASEDQMVNSKRAIYKPRVGK